MAFKTNAMRILDQSKIPYSTKEYDYDETDLSGVHAAEEMGIPPETVFKTLVTKGEGKNYYVFCIPVASELDLKKCAQIAKCKSIEMIHVKDLLGITGYIRGGCSPIGMKKLFPTFIDESASSYETIFVSAGQRGHQIGLAPEALANLVHASFAAPCR